MTKKKDTTGNVIKMPLKPEPQAIHRAMAEQHKPSLNPLTIEEAKIWDVIAPELAVLGRLRAHYIDSLAEYCRITAKMAKDRAWLDEHGWTYKSESRNGTQWKSQPLVAQLNSDWLKWLALAKFLGLTPASDKVKSQSGDHDEFDNF